MWSVVFCPVCGSPNAGERLRCKACDAELDHRVIMATLVPEEGAGTPAIQPRRLDAGRPLGILSGTILGILLLGLSGQLILSHPPLGIGLGITAIGAGVIAFVAGNRRLTQNRRVGFRGGFGMGLAIIMIGALLLAALVIGLFIVCAIAARAM